MTAPPMASQLERRVAALESVTADRSAAYMWRNIGQTAEQAIAAEFPGGVPPGVAVTVIGWLEPALVPAFGGACSS